MQSLIDTFGSRETGVSFDFYDIEKGEIAVYFDRKACRPQTGELDVLRDFARDRVLRKIGIDIGKK